MITINIDTQNKTAALAAAAVVKAGPFDEDITVIFSADPGASVETGLQLAISTADANPATLAYTNTWAKQSATNYTAPLDLSDTRLNQYMTSRSGQASLNLEISMVVGGKRYAPANLPITVQPTALHGAQTTIGGPVYYTEAETDTAIAAAIAAALANYPHPLPNVVGVTGGGSTHLDGITTNGVYAFGALVSFIDATNGFVVWQLTNTTAANDAATQRAADYADPAHTAAWKRRI